MDVVADIVDVVAVEVALVVVVVVVGKAKCQKGLVRLIQNIFSFQLEHLHLSNFKLMLIPHTE